jgi:thioredoxin 1
MKSAWMLWMLLMAGVLSMPLFADGPEGARGKPPEAAASEPGIPWLKDLPKALEAAQEKRRTVMIDFEAEWCSWCKKLDRETYGDERVIRFVREHFIAVKIDTDEQPEVAKQHQVAGLPTILFLSAGGEELARLIGFRTPEAFLRDAAKPAQAAAKLDELKEALEKDPADLGARRAYARALFAAGNAPEAARLLEEALEKAPADAGLLLDLADALRAERRTAEARRTYEKIIALPREAAGAERDRAFLPLARLLVAARDHKAAIAVLGRLLEEQPASPERIEALFLRGYAHAVLKDAASAIEDIKSARELGAGGPWALRAGYILDLVSP